MSGDREFGTCEACDKEDVALNRKYYYYSSFKNIKYCESCSPDATPILRQLKSIYDLFDSEFELGLSLVIKELKRDQELYDVWFANIAQSFDISASPDLDLPQIGRAGAKAFLDLLINQGEKNE